MDHIKPKSWQGDVYVKNVSLQSSWSEGHRIAEGLLTKVSLVPPFISMEASGGYYLLCPFSGNKIVLIDRVIAPGEAEETLEEQDWGGELDETPLPDTTKIFADSARLHSDSEHLSNLDDILGIEDTSHSLSSQKYEAWILIDDNLTVQKHKATILADCTNPLKSKDRLRCVCGYTQYNEPTALSPPVGLLGDTSSSHLKIQDPVVTLIACSDLDMVFVGIIQVIDIRVSGTSVQWIPLELLHEPNIHLCGQVLMLKVIDHSHQPVGPDWEWDGTLNACSKIWKAIQQCSSIQSCRRAQKTRSKLTHSKLKTSKELELCCLSGWLTVYTESHKSSQPTHFHIGWKQVFVLEYPANCLTWVQVQHASYVKGVVVYVTHKRIWSAACFALMPTSSTSQVQSFSAIWGHTSSMIHR